MKRLLPLAIATLILISGCSDSDDGSSSTSLSSVTEVQKSDTKTSPIRVLNTFNVGKGIYVRSLAEEKSNGSLWVGTSTGVMEIDLKTQELKNTFNRDQGLANEYVFAIFVDSKGYKWFGTNGGGVSRYRDGEWKTFFPMHGLADYWIYAFTEQPDGGLWIGTWAGANLYRPEGEKFTTYVKELINEWVYGLGIDSKNRIWFGTEGGVSMFDGKQWLEWNHKDGLGAENINHLSPSTNTGLGTRSRHDLSTLQLGKNTYNPNYVFSILIDNKDEIWAGTWGGGVSHFDGSQWHNFNTEDGLAGNIVYSSAQDNEGAYWFGTNAGLSRYD
ncbi:MAG: hypothetical protein OEL79_11405, partial [Chromatiales bacterium]|nr:hypothetical protein [Chromatiales bacterium]